MNRKSKRHTLFSFASVVVLTALVSVASAAKKTTCDAVFQSAAPSVKAAPRVAKVVVAVPAPVSKAVAAPAAARARATSKAVKSADVPSIGVTETITNVFNGSQLYTVILGKSGKKNAQGSLPGIYKRGAREWSLLIPGEVMVDNHGVPQITQLALGQTDKGNYVVAIVNGNIHLLTDRSNITIPKSQIQFGTAENPLFELGSMQKRFLPVNQGDAKISVYQDPNLTDKGSQLVMVSMKFSQPQMVGEGITFAFEVLPNGESTDVRLNGRPVVLDYDFHSVGQLERHVTGSKTKVLFSKILLEQFQNSEGGFIGRHLDIVREIVTKHVNDVLGAISPATYLQTPNERVAYDITSGTVEKDVQFSRMLFEGSHIRIEQRYLVSAGRSEIQIFAAEPKKIRLDGALDLYPDRTPVVWTGINRRDVMFSKDGILYAYVKRAENSDESLLVKLGTFYELFPSMAISQIPKDLTFKTFMQDGRDAVSPGFLLISTKMQSGREFTGVVRLNLLLNKTLQKNDSYILSEIAMSAEDIKLRLKPDDGKPLFDVSTPILESIAAYEQAYDKSKPHVDLLASSANPDSRNKSALEFRFRGPRETTRIGEGLTYAEFSDVPGVENSTGLYTNVSPHEISGNEKDVIRGQLLTRQGVEADPLKPEAAYVFAKLDVQVPRFNEGTTGKTPIYDPNAPTVTRKLNLLAIDAHKKNGAAGYRLVLQVPNATGTYESVILSQFERTTWAGNLALFQDAFFVQGRGADRDYAYLFVSFAGLTNVGTPKEKRIEASYSVRIHLGATEKFDALDRRMIAVASLENEVLRTKDAQTRIGFDDDGVPNLVLTPELNESAHLFTVFNLKRAAKEYPNRSTTKGSKKLKFGELLTAGADAEESFITYKDSWEANAAAIRTEYPNLSRSHELAQLDNFVDIGKHLDAMSDTTKKPERTILIVPETLRELVWDFVLSKGFAPPANPTHGYDPKALANTFSSFNRKLTINVFDPRKQSQEQYFANLENWARSKRKKPDERNLLLARMDALRGPEGEPPRASDGDGGFYLDYVGASDETDLAQISTSTRAYRPSALYLLSAGEPMKLEEFRKTQNAEPAASMLIVATPEEMKEFEARHGQEVENNLLGRFKIQEIKNPDDESMAKSLAEIFHHRDVQSLDFKFSAKEIMSKKNLNSEESFDVVIRYAISRFASLSAHKRDSRFEAFMRFRAIFAQSVLTDKEVRRTRLINRYFVERVLTQVFDIPINLQALASDDPLVLLSKPDILRKLQDAGYPGPFSIKKQMVDAVLSQTEPESGKTMPSSILLGGPTGLGKTRLFKALIKVLGLKEYNFHPTKADENNDAGAISVNVATLREREGEDGMGVDSAITHLNNMIAGPNGHRAFILLDDVHGAPNEVKAKVVSWVRNLHDAPEGMITIRRSGLPPVRKPIRNITLVLIVNPMAHQNSGKDKDTLTMDDMALAALSTPNQKLEHSFLRRMGHVLKWEKLPASAKAPELLSTLSDSSNALLNSMNRIALVDPRVIAKIVQDSDGVDGRTFSDSATRALMGVASADRHSGAVVLVVPSLTKLSSKPLPPQTNESEGARVMKAVARETRTLSLDATVEGKLVFVKLIADAFRIPVYESFVTALQENPKFSGTVRDQRELLAPILSAVSDHFEEHTYITFPDLNLNASDFNHTGPGERDAFRIALEDASKNQGAPILPDSFKMIESVATTFQHVLGPNSTASARGRRHVIAESIEKNRGPLEKRLAQVMRVDDLESLPNPSGWLGHLHKDAPPSSKELGNALVENFRDFFGRMVDKTLVENRSPEIPAMTLYAATRLYLYSIDRTILKMRWTKSASFLLTALELITEDQVLSQKAGVQSFLFKDPERLIKPSIPDLTVQLIQSTEVLDEISAATREAQRNEFKRQVNQYLLRTSH